MHVFNERIDDEFDNSPLADLNFGGEGHAGLKWLTLPFDEEEGGSGLDVNVEDHALLLVFVAVL